MQTKFIKTALVSALISAGLSSTAMAHSIVGGYLSGTTGSVDVFRTTCVNFDSTAASASHYGHPGPAQGFIFAVSLVSGSPVTATVGYTYTSNIEGPNSDGANDGTQTTSQSNNPNNVLPAQFFATGSTPAYAPTVLTATATDTTTGAAWTNTTTEPPFTGYNTSTGSPFGTAAFLDAADTQWSPNYLTGNGEYVIVISHTGSTPTQYDFIGHCINKSVPGALDPDSAHTGQGTWWSSSPSSFVQALPDYTNGSSLTDFSSGQTLYSAGDYDQVIGDDVYANTSYPPLHVLPSPYTHRYNTYGE
jgi:hypothetical protein